MATHDDTVLAAVAAHQNLNSSIDALSYLAETFPEDDGQAQILRLLAAAMAADCKALYGLYPKPKPEPVKG